MNDRLFWILTIIIVVTDIICLIVKGPTAKVVAGIVLALYVIFFTFYIIFHVQNKKRQK